MAKQELIKLEEFNIQQLPELQNKKQEVSKKLKEFKYVAITDNATYEDAKKSRTGARTLRTSLQKEQKDVEKKIKDHILAPVKSAYDEIINDMVSPIEDKQQEEVSRWEEIKEQERQDKLRLEQERVDGIKKVIVDFYDTQSTIFRTMKFEDIDSVKSSFEAMVDAQDKKALEEFEVLYDTKVAELYILFDQMSSVLKREEENRLAELKLEEDRKEIERVNNIKNSIANWVSYWNRKIDSLTFNEIVYCRTEFNEEKSLNCQEFQSEYAEQRKILVEKLATKVSALQQAEKERIALEEQKAKQKAEAEKLEEQKLNLRFEQRKFELTKIGVLEFDSEKVKSISEEEFDSYLESLKPKPVEEIEVVAPEEVVERTFETNFDEFGKPIEEISFAEHLLQQENTPVFDSKIFGDQSEPRFSNLVKELEFEETWESIYDQFEKETGYDYYNSTELFIDWLTENYNVPTRK